MQRFQKLLVALDRSDRDSSLISYAAGIAKLGTVEELRFVHVLPGEGASLDTATQEINAAVRTHAPDIPGVSIVCDILEGPLTDALLTHSAEKHSDVLLVGQGSDPRNGSRLVRRLAMKSSCSVWVVPADFKSSIGKILVPIDFSKQSADCLQVAASMARLCGASECYALHVYFNEAVVTYEGYDRVIRGEEESAYREFVGEIDLQGVTVTPLFRESANVPRAIAREAARVGADLIVMATRGRSRSSSILLGSVTEQMIEDTHIPLLAVKHFGARMSVLEALLDRRFLQKGELRAV